MLSAAAGPLLARELHVHVDLGDENSVLDGLYGLRPPGVKYTREDDFSAEILRPGYAWTGMVIIPCSAGMLGALAYGSTMTLIEKAATLTLRAKRRLVVVPHDTPLGTIQIQSMLRLSRAGAAIVPAIGSLRRTNWDPETQFDFIIGKVLEQFDGAFSHLLSDQRVARGA